MASNNPQSSQQPSVEKLFVVSLPRTATTSFCLAMLEQGFTVAHTAYTQETFARAKVIADTPVFSDYARLDRLYPDARFVYLERNPDEWLPSIRQLLLRMQKNLQRQDGGFNPILKRCYGEVFGQYSEAELSQDQYLLDCYYQHQQQVVSYFAERDQDFLRLQANDPLWWQSVATLIDHPMTPAPFPHVNKGGKVTKWNDLKHPLKIDSTRNGRSEDLFKTLYR
ncbi:sulfotransferase [Thalassotalea mangrovi]|uniref:Sulfotransferase family protein n=1 Tax=Thalassotalea mangrovi TaxID=2572245 RepID=A0A4U1B7A1_9GAMM|nr:sulfotransferase [Thalassotalea mangrovi]TKB45756.1 sulfotransferase family protein [Thalassotalea mangrovi]